IDDQQSFADVFAVTYRRLAELLLNEGRLLEAQQVLELLKFHELDTYLHDVRGEIKTDQIRYWQLEGNILRLYKNAIASGQELLELRSLPINQLTPQQQQRLNELVQQEGDLLDSFYDFLNFPEVSNTLQELRQIVPGQTIEPTQLNSLQDDLRQLNANAVLLYPLILADHIELLIVSPFSPPMRYPVEVTDTELNAAILAFRQSLSDRTSDPIPLAQQFYQWLIEPIESQLVAAQVETIIYAPDGPLRYVPLAALHDGEQWLAERYRINHITAASLTDLTERNSSQIQLLAAAFTNAANRYTVTINDRDLNFAGLPYAGVEVETLADLFPNTTQFLDQEFSRAATVPSMGSHTIVHLATHAVFVPDDPQASFIMFGNGDIVTLTEIRRWNLPQVDLVILSACETGLGGFGDGAEILGFGYQIQRTGARAAIASLWPVSDGGTQELMINFYRALQIEGMTKAAALQRAQIALISGNQVEDGAGQRFALIPRDRDAPSALSPQGQLSHPYYWAPFILIGNGL
ncbi:MAG: CHAT domain-containing protein, partial [Cyanobacteria bacterium J06638_6]